MSSLSMAEDYSLGLTGGWSRVSLKTDPRSYSGNGWNLGFSQQYNIDPNLFLKADVSYVAANMEGNLEFAFFKIPLLVGGIVHATEELGFYGAIGPVIDYLSKSNYESRSTKQSYNKFTIAGGLAAGIQYALMDQLRVSFDMRYDIPFMKLNKKVLEGTYKVSNLQAGIGIHWIL